MPKPKFDESKLPRRVQDLLWHERRKARDLASELERTQKAHALLLEREWFTIHGPPKDSAISDPLGKYELFFCDRGGTHSACVLMPGDVLLVGREKRKEVPRV